MANDDEDLGIEPLQMIGPVTWEADQIAELRAEIAELRAEVADARFDEAHANKAVQVYTDGYNDMLAERDWFRIRCLNAETTRDEAGGARACFWCDWLDSSRRAEIRELRAELDALKGGDDEQGDGP